MDADLNFWSCNPDDCVVSGKEITWHYDDFEPLGNIEFEIIKPSVWLRVLTETENTRVNANDGEAWGRLAKAYKDAIMTRKGYLRVGEHYPSGTELFSLSREAYQKATTLLPDDADWHYGFADLLCRYTEWNAATLETWIACIEQVKLALDINPDHEGANELLQRIRGEDNFVDLSGPEPIYLILTPQPAATNTPAPQDNLPTPSLTPPPQSIATATSTKITSTDLPAHTATPHPPGLLQRFKQHRNRRKHKPRPAFTFLPVSLWQLRQ